VAIDVLLFKRGGAGRTESVVGRHSFPIISSWAIMAYDELSAISDQGFAMAAYERRFKPRVVLVKLNADR
jgi:hypothetical protein